MGVWGEGEEIEEESVVALWFAPFRSKGASTLVKNSDIGRTFLRLASELIFRRIITTRLERLAAGGGRGDH